ncbi:hypothetical protein [Aquibacillus kalidii]|uniref:hypothetical protein n=1 Tax=Aquibacillus kalidii TaxID=2762597 RepID=UPI0016443270|nr:hypothetical protein [Aquibacillus kalidii]
MKKITLGLLNMILVLSILGCSTSNNQETNYYVLVVEGENNISGTFGEFANKEYSVVEVEYITSLARAKEKYPNYEIENTPAVFIFETGGGEMKKIKLKTYEVEEAIEFLRDTKK